VTVSTRDNPPTQLKVRHTALLSAPGTPPRQLAQDTWHGCQHLGHHPSSLQSDTLHGCQHLGHHLRNLRQTYGMAVSTWDTTHATYVRKWDSCRHLGHHTCNLCQTHGKAISTLDTAHTTYSQKWHDCQPGKPPEQLIDRLLARLSPPGTPPTVFTARLKERPSAHPASLIKLTVSDMARLSPPETQPTHILHSETWHGCHLGNHPTAYVQTQATAVNNWNTTHTAYM
jgi:hypothetical protein